MCQLSITKFKRTVHLQWIGLGHCNIFTHTFVTQESMLRYVFFKISLSPQAHDSIAPSWAWNMSHHYN